MVNEHDTAMLQLAVSAMMLRQLDILVHKPPISLDAKNQTPLPIGDVLQSIDAHIRQYYTDSGLPLPAFPGIPGKAAPQ